MLLETEYFQWKKNEEKKLKMLTPKQRLQRLPTALTQVNTDNTFKDLLNEIRQTIYSLNWAKEITKKVYNNIMNLIKV